MRDDANNGKRPEDFLYEVTTLGDATTIRLCRKRPEDFLYEVTTLGDATTLGYVASGPRMSCTR